ncbi:MAG: DUF262 and DUF1524 domain-containing protein [Planctomycetia bacterium]|nr:DUF262 and DUF1524 domain-containing protein [Planctomycetia bacterium]
MRAEDHPVTHLLNGAKQFIVPIFQRDYSWGTKHCLQLWNDVVRVGKDANAKWHFLGSVVYVAAEDNSPGIGRWLVIDGQQRLTTLSLLLIALRNRIQQAKEGELPETLPSAEEVDDYYLRNRHGKEDRKNKLALRRMDQETLVAIVDGKDVPKPASERVQKNFEFFVELIKDADLEIVHNGIKKLVIVDVSLVRGQDDPQMIFESLNSTGLDLTQADLIRNFILMRQDADIQTQLYHDYWQPIERAFGGRYRTDFDNFIRDYLTLALKPSKQFRKEDIYHQFRTFFYAAIENQQVGDILADIKRQGDYYAAFSLGQEEVGKLKEPFKRLRSLVEVASPLMLRLYHCHKQAKTLTLDEFVEATELLESYVFRRVICEMQTRNLGQIFASLAYRINESEPLLSLKVALARQGEARCFPTDDEFREALETRNIYHMTRTRNFLLDRLENDSDEKIDTVGFSIEHVMPQNPTLRAEWQAMLGPDWKQIQQTWLNRLGNVTLTAYNSEYSDRPFDEKKTAKDKEGNEVGFNSSPLRLNKFVREQTQWTQKEIEQRGKELSARALKIWKPLGVDVAAVKKSELEEKKAQAAKYTIESLELDEVSRPLCDKLRAKILELGQDVVELFGSKTATYRVYDFFVEVLPRRHRLLLLLNLDFPECNDPSGIAADATDTAWISNASESGGVVCSVRQESEIPAAMNLIRQAYENTAE